MRTHQPVTLDWLDQLKPEDDELMTYLGRSTWPECGFMMFNLSNHWINDFITRLRLIYDGDDLFSMREWHDSYVIGELIKDLRGEGRRFKNIGDDTKPDGYHVFNNSILGERLDHLKGPRKFVGSSTQQDIDNPERRTERYWKEVPKKDSKYFSKLRKTNEVGG